MSLEQARQLNGRGGGGIDMERSAEGDGGASIMGRLSLDVSCGGGGGFRPSTLLDEYERLAIEAQLNRAVLRRSYSEPSPSRPAAVAVQDEAATAGLRPEQEKVGAGRAPARRFWLLEALKRLLCWLGVGGGGGGALGGPGRWEERAPRCPPAPAAPPRVQLLDYLSNSAR